MGGEFYELFIEPADLGGEIPDRCVLGLLTSNPDPAFVDSVEAGELIED